jgi:hypothetical protein
MSARTGSKRMTNHNTPQLSRMDLANHCAAFPGLSLLNTLAVPLTVPCINEETQTIWQLLQMPLPYVGGTVSITLHRVKSPRRRVQETKFAFCSINASYGSALDSSTLLPPLLLSQE